MLGRFGTALQGSVHVAAFPGEERGSKGLPGRGIVRGDAATERDKGESWTNDSAAPTLPRKSPFLHQLAVRIHKESTGAHARTHSRCTHDAREKKADGGRKQVSLTQPPHTPPTHLLYVQLHKESQVLRRPASALQHRLVALGAIASRPAAGAAGAAAVSQ